ncbi:pimeloyl-ACP methyl ester carboxylesterase [Anoxybacillus calidus]|jgi:pimeloyl-ACP methyl ester carboxylesterase|uniref:Pimeloyl-ACP methyl ester carboxylesterase n=1 Tax=[Anoxybacillus] calidus TaxID=575178 RepID=A0A7V9YZW8_9BACL|nr:alpha/beta hydrolase [Anoxybacillus calidus]MBA2871522.1 pimeloyl-ACP methyl ester carboxylesterase [Anoxybacillus calidus]
MTTIAAANHFTANIHGVNIHYELYNQRSNQPFIVLIHGFLSSTFSYRRLIPYLMNDFSVLALDLPPFGKSEKSIRFQYTYKNLATLVIELLARLQIRSCILVGHSMGGQISLNIAKQRPDLVQQMILLCSSGYLKRAQMPLLLSTYIPYFHLYVKRWLERQGVEKNLLNVIYDHSLIDEEMCKGYEQPFYDEQIFKALARLIRHREGDLSSEELKKIKTPSLLVWGEEDKVVPIHIGKRLHQDLPNSQFISFPKTGHLLPEEKPSHVYEQILRFIH